MTWTRKPPTEVGHYWVAVWRTAPSILNRGLALGYPGYEVVISEVFGPTLADGLHCTALWSMALPLTMLKGRDIWWGDKLVFPAPPVRRGPARRKRVSRKGAPARRSATTKDRRA